MRYVSEKYEHQLEDLAEHLRWPVGDATPERQAALPAFETALGHLVLTGQIDAEQAYRQMGWPVSPDKGPEAA